MNKKRLLSIIFLTSPLIITSVVLLFIDKNTTSYSDSVSMLFNIILCIIGFAVTTISIAFMFNRSNLFKKESKI